MLDDMGAAGVTPNGVTYNAIVACCVRAGQADEAASADQATPQQPLAEQPPACRWELEHLPPVRRKPAA